MNIEIGENLSISLTICIVALGIFTILGYGCNQVEETKRLYVEEGYHQVKIDGTTASTMWQKVEASPEKE